MKDTKGNFLRLLDETWPGLAREFTRAMAEVRSAAGIEALEAAIDRNDVDAAFAALRMERATLFPFEAAIGAAFVSGGQYQMEAVRTSTRRQPEGRRVIQSFGGRNERAERIAREMGATRVVEIMDDTRTLVAEAIRDGIRGGRNPRSTALDIAGRVTNGRRTGGLVGLNNQQAGYVQNMRRELADPDRISNYFTRTRRDRRFDQIVSRAMVEGRAVAQDDIERIAGRYAGRLLNLRGETIARTESLSALNAGRNEAIEQLIENPANDITAADVTRRWNDTGDSRTRPSHGAADGQIVGKDEPFTVGGWQMMHPGDSSLGAAAEEIIACRCYMDISTTR